MDEPTLIELTDPENELARQALELYEVSFPVEERVPLEAVQEDIRNQARGANSEEFLNRYMAAVRDGSTVGLSMYGYYRDPRLAFLYYMAIQPELRGKGLGAWLLNETTARLTQDARALHGPPARGLCWEVERPDESDDPEERLLRERRINFYKRNGAILLDGIDFTAPPISEGLPPVTYYLMFKPVPDEAVTIDPDLLQAVVDATLLYGYGVEEESPYYRQAIASIRVS
jgi:GNAT superfamily N-acetyltransferase